MAEVLAVVGTIGAVCNIIDIISKTITLISDVQSRWRTADLALVSLASQLTTLRAALREIKTWLEKNTQNIHHQLTMDLDVSLSCCRLLVSELETFFARLDKSSDSLLGAKERMRVVIGSQGANDIQKFIEHQTSSLTLLLTACNCATLYEQRLLLEKPKSRKSIDRVKADSVSLLVHCDSRSFVSRWTDNLSKLSYVFDFDKEVLSTKVYEGVFRNTLKRSIRDRSVLAHTVPVRYVLLMGDNGISKMNAERSILSCHIYEKSADAVFLSNSDLTLQRLCVVLTLLVIRQIYKRDSCFFEPDKEQLLNTSLPSKLWSEDANAVRDEDSIFQTIAALWRHPTFHHTLRSWDTSTIVDNILTAEEVKYARSHILSRIAKRQLQLCAEPEYHRRSTCVPQHISNVSSTTMILGQLSTALYTSWIPHGYLSNALEGYSLPLAMFYVFDMDTGSPVRRLREVALSFLEMKPPKEIVLVMLFVASHNVTEDVVHDFYAAMPQLMFQHFIISKDGSSSSALKTFLSSLLLNAAKKRQKERGHLEWNRWAKFEEEVEEQIKILDSVDPVGAEKQRAQEWYKAANP